MNSKSEMRIEARARRKALALAMPDFAARLAAQAEALALKPGMIIGGYHALPDEADPARLLARLVELGCHIAFPRVAAMGRLEFHRVPDGEVLTPGAYGIQEPASHFPAAMPHVLLVPLLAFDGDGNRLGQGGGFYDRTLADTLGIRAIGIAYAEQEVSSLPHEPHDMALDEILTEHGLRRFP